MLTEFQRRHAQLFEAVILMAEFLETTFCLNPHRQPHRAREAAA
jgi:hypothetical protein